MEEYTFLLTIASIIVPVCATIIVAVYTVVSRVKAEHKPYLILEKIESLSNLDKCLYFVTMLGNKIRNKYPDKEIELLKNSNDNIDVKIRLRNIGYGVATNVRFYDLNTGLKISGSQELSDDIDQKLFTTFDIASSETKSVQTSLITKVKEGKVLEDTISIMCVYQDLNNNVYNFVFVINLKQGGGYNYYAFQPSSKSYQNLIKKYKKQKRKILYNYKY